MKKLFFTIVITCAIAGAALADTVISPEDLPNAAKAFIAENFPNETVTYAESDFFEYEAYLSNGAKIAFTGTGNWEEVKCRAGVPTGFFPQKIGETIAKKYPEAVVIKAEKERKNYELRLSNRMKLYFDLNGKFLGEKFDD